MSTHIRCRVYAIILIVVVLLACQIGPQSPQPTSTFEVQAAPTSAPTETPLPVLPTYTSTTTPDVETPTVSPTATTLPPPLIPTPTPPLPDEGDLPALWTQIDFGIEAGDLYYPAGLTIDTQAGVAYALGRCELTPYYDESGPTACLSRLDLESGLVMDCTQLQASYSSDLVLAGETLYVNQSWNGALLALDAETLQVREVISDVLRVTFDGQETVYAAVHDGVMRLAPDRVVAPFDFSQEGFSDSIVDIAATTERVYVLGYEALWLFSSELAPIATIDLQSCGSRDLALDGERLYVGCNQGLYALDMETERLEQMPVKVRGVDKLALGEQDGSLYAITHHPSDWFGGTSVVALDTMSWQTRTLFSTLEGWLPDLIVDGEQNRLLVASYDDHALIPIDLTSGEIAPRLPLGIEVMEAIVDQETDRLYVSDSAGWVHVLDRQTYDESKRLYGGRAISLDGPHKRLYAGDARLSKVIVLDTGLMDSLREIEQPGTPRADPSTGQVAIVNRRFYLYDGETGKRTGELRPGIGVPPPEFPGGYYTVAREVVFDAQRGLTATITYTPWPGKPGPQESIAVDPASGRAYYALLTGGYIHFSSIDMYADLSAVQRNALEHGISPPAPAPILTLEGLSGYLALDTAARRLYVARDRILFVLDSETLNRLGRVETGETPPTGWLPRVAAIDDELGRLYTPHESELAIWTRTGGAAPAPQPHAPMVVTRTVSSILPSPNLAHDRTLLATINSRFCRSTDGGKTWQRLRGGLPEIGETVAVVDAAFSPDYANDQTIAAGITFFDSHGEGVWISRDGGETWQQASDGLYHLRVYQIALSPDYANDSTLLAYAHAQNGDVLYRSSDSGANWDLLVRQTGYNLPPLPRPEELFRQQDQTGQTYGPEFRCDFDGACERSDDGGSTWAPFDTSSVQLDRLVTTVRSPRFQTDGVVYFLTESGLYRAWLNEGIWQRCTAPFFNNRTDYTRALTALAAAETTDRTYTLFVGTADGGFYSLDATNTALWEQVRRMPAATREPPTPVPCTAVPEAYPVDERFGIDYANLPQKLGCAIEPGTSSWVALQRFERGTMFWRQDNREIYVLQDDATWASYQDTWEDGQPVDDPALAPPPQRIQPIRGFGKVWREQLGGATAKIGWAMEGEYGFETAIQGFQDGIAIMGPEMTLYVLYNDGRWETVKAGM